MNQIQTGQLIRQLRLARRMTQRTLAERIGVTDKAVSKWERGCGVPDVETLPILVDVLQADVKALLSGSLDEAKSASGNLRRVCFFVCPVCGNVIAVRDDGEWYITAPHEMHREHYISFVAFLTGDTMIVKKQYPEWGLDVRLPYIRHGMLLWYCTRDGLFYQNI